jgi:hypothetical protein
MLSCKEYGVPKFPLRELPLPESSFPMDPPWAVLFTESKTAAKRTGISSFLGLKYKFSVIFFIFLKASLRNYNTPSVPKKDKRQILCVKVGMRYFGKWRKLLKTKKSTEIRFHEPHLKYSSLKLNFFNFNDVKDAL